MDIWILNHYAETPKGRATRSFDIGKRLVQRGHRVTIFASSFSHYEFREEHLGEHIRYKEEDTEGVRFIWLRTFPYQKNNWRRIRNMFSYYRMAMKVGMELPEEPDVIIGTHVHPMAPVAAYRLAKRKGSRFFFEVTDLWPQTLLDLGAVSPWNPIVWMLWKWEEFLYRKADRIIALLPQAHEYIHQYGVSRSKVLWIPNGVDVSRYDELEGYDGATDHHFEVYYLGGIVQSNHLDVVQDAAKLLQERSPKVRFTFVGEGTDKPRLLDRADRLGLKNLTFRGVFQKRDIARVMTGADAFIFSLRNLPLYNYGISLNKMCDYLASRRPIIFAGNPPHNPVAEAECGVVVSPEDAEALAAGVEKLANMSPEERVKLGQNGFAYLKKFHDMDVLAERLEEAMKQFV